MRPVVGLVVLQGTLTCRTGIHVGALPETLDVCTTDAPVVRNPLTGRPYIPGSSLRGKLRWLLERSAVGHTTEFFPEVAHVGGHPIRLHTCQDENCPICRLFGVVPREQRAQEEGMQGYASLLSVWDLEPESAPLATGKAPQRTTRASRRGHGDAADGVSRKAENSVDRLTSAANPRDLERVAQGTVFRLRLTYAVRNPSLLQEDLETLLLALALLEDDALGGGGSRGSGAVQVQVREIEARTMKYYSGTVAGESERFRRVFTGAWTLAAFGNEWEKVITAFTALLTGET